jgi:hypothetical protein
MTGSHDIISSHRMENLLKKFHSRIISQLHSIQEVETPSPSMNLDLQSMLSQQQSIFHTSQGLPLSQEPMIIPFP